MKAKLTGVCGSPDSLLPDLETFFAHLVTAGYAKRTLRKKRSVLKAFSRWIRLEQIDLPGLNDTQISAFVGRLSESRKEQIKMERSTLRRLPEYLRVKVYVGLATAQSRPDPVPGRDLMGRYVDNLRNDRGLAENSILVYAPLIRNFLGYFASRFGAVEPSTFDAQVVQEFLLACSRSRSSEYTRLTATALRSFFRFLFQLGETKVDLSRSVPPVRRWVYLAPHSFLSPAEVKVAISTPDLSTQRGRRDRAILLLLARLGLRAGEVIALELDDIRWRAGEIVVRGKGRVRISMPLLSDVGEALALYLRVDRCTKENLSRRVFLRLNAPQVALAGPAAVAHIVRLALSRAGLRQPRRRASHLFRHSLGTQMIQQGATLPEIAEVLRHKSQSTTAIYARVSFEALREVARPWPATFTAMGGSNERSS